MGDDLRGYENCGTRVLALAPSRLSVPSESEIKKLALAATFHDLGLWTENTVDYLPPSITLAKKHLAGAGLSAWNAEREAIIDFHHKVTPYRGPFSLAEGFRKADLADFSLEIFTSGISKTLLCELQIKFPNAGFHRTLSRLTYVQPNCVSFGSI